MIEESQLVTVTDLMIYPIKSCAGIAVEQLMFDDIGPRHDRRYMVVQPDGRFLTQRQLPIMSKIVPELVIDGLVLTLVGQDEVGSCVVLQPDQTEWLDTQVWKDKVRGLDCGDQVADWLELVLGRPARLVFMPDDVVRPVDPEFARSTDRVGFADGFPLLVTHQASADFLSEQLGRRLEMARFRPNVVVSGGLAFDELNWRYLEDESGSSLHLVKPCTRCVIPLRNLDSLEREDDVTELLSAHCRIGKKIIFGQNALLREGQSINLGSCWRVSS